jgi:hypothetical protein
VPDAEQRLRRGIDLEQSHSAARPEDPGTLGQHRRESRKIAEGKPADETVE